MTKSKPGAGKRGIERSAFNEPSRSYACRGVKKHGGEVKLNAHVDQVLMERGRAVGVLLKSGQVIKTRKVIHLPHELSCILMRKQLILK